MIYTLCLVSNNSLWVSFKISFVSYKIFLVSFNSDFYSWDNDNNYYISNDYLSLLFYNILFY
jgi:hypothetical protein